MNILYSKSSYFIPLLLIIISYSIYAFNLEGQSWVGDEIYYNTRGGIAVDLIEKGDLLNPCWNGIGECNLLYVVKGDDTLYQGHIRHVLVGIGQHMAGKKTNEDLKIWSSWGFKFWKEEYLPTPQDFAAG